MPLINPLVSSLFSNLLLSVSFYSYFKICQNVSDYSVFNYSIFHFFCFLFVFFFSMEGFLTQLILLFRIDFTFWLSYFLSTSIYGLFRFVYVKTTYNIIFEIIYKFCFRLKNITNLPVISSVFDWP